MHKDIHITGYKITVFCAVLVNFCNVNCSWRAPPLLLLRMKNLMVSVFICIVFHNCSVFILLSMLITYFLFGKYFLMLYQDIELFSILREWLKKGYYLQNFQIPERCSSILNYCAERNKERKEKYRYQKQRE